MDQIQIYNSTVSKQQQQQQYHLQVTSFGTSFSHYQTMHGLVNYIRNYTTCHLQESNRNHEQLKLNKDNVL